MTLPLISDPKRAEDLEAAASLIWEQRISLASGLVSIEEVSRSAPLALQRFESDLCAQVYLTPAMHRDDQNRLWHGLGV
jgi:hypothetical protein